MTTYNTLGVSPQSIVSGAAIGINRVVKRSAANTGIVTTAITDVPIGVAMIAASAAGEVVPLQSSGIAKCVASDAISEGAQVMCTASGAGKVVTAAGATAYSIGIARTAAGADGDVIEVQLMLAGAGPANS